MIIPRLPDPEIIEAPVEGMLAYDSTNKTIRYYDGTTWSTLMYSSKEKKINEGVVKIISGGPNAGKKPNWTNVQANSTRQVFYASPLIYASSPTTSWSENDTVNDSKIYNNGKFIENSVLGQVHQWRLIVNYTKNSSNFSQDIKFILRNPLSNFRLEIIGAIQPTKTSGILVYDFTTTADEVSLPTPLGSGGGYILEWVASNALSKISIDSITRFSYHKD